MPLTMTDLRGLADRAGLRYFIDPQRDALLMSIRGMHGVHHVLIILELDGNFLQFRTVDNAFCPLGHPYLEKVLRVIGSINFRTRVLKVGWDPSDGEIAAYADMWVIDGVVGQVQFESMLQNFLTAFDMNYPRLMQTLATGVDPEGEESPPAGNSLPD